MDPYAFTTAPLRFSRPARQIFNLKRWYRGKRDVSTWDGVRRDVDLFEDDANCSIFLYAKGQSQRGPAFRLPAQKLIEAQCEPLLELAHRTISGKDCQTERLELYLPAPTGLLREDALKCHIATRNFFAWLCQRPLVGHFLGTALADLLDSMRLWRGADVDNVEDILIFADRMGYSVVEHRPDNALAMLAFSEKARIRHVWVDSFAHCTGMSSEITNSSEFEPISRVTKALITRAFLEMDLHLDRTSGTLVGFLEHELSASYLGLSDGARHHLDYFRTFLHSFYVGRFGYWPPYHPTNFPKDLYYDMYDDFSSLYHLLADKGLSNTQVGLKSANGGICVEQNVEAFNSRHKFNPLPYPIPLIPQLLADEKSKSQINLRALRFGKDGGNTPSKKTDQVRRSLRAATNSHRDAVNQPGLVHSYLAWEDENALRTEQKVSPADARKVRWILIYGILQTLVSAIQAPPEVRDTTTATYPLCILTDGLPPWDDAESVKEHPSLQARAIEESEPPSSANSDDGRQAATPTPTFSIHPDCETDNYYDHSSNKTIAPDSHTAPPKGSLKRASTRLRKPSIKRRSMPARPQISTQSELVSGRTLAELGYGGDSGFANDSPVVAGFDFDFGFDQPKEERHSMSSDESIASPTSTATNSTFDNFQDSLPAHAVSYSHGNFDDRSSIPSLTYSHGTDGSRETVDSIYSWDRSSAIQYADSCKRADSDASAKQAQIERQRQEKAVEAEEPCPYVVTGFTDLFAKPKNGVDSDASSESDYVDRAAVIQHDGTLDDEVVDKYRSLSIS